MICPYCGQANPDDIDTCNFCGGSLLASAEQPLNETQAAQAGVESPEASLDSDRPLSEVEQASSAPKETGFTPIPPPPPASGGIYSNRLWWIVGCVVFLCIIASCVAIVFALYRYTKVFGFLNPDTTTSQNSPTAILTPAIIYPVSSTPGNSAASPSGSSSQNSTILFYDDFSDPSTGWDQVDDSDYSTKYYQGSYRITVKSDMWESWANPAGQDFKDVSIEADASKIGGPDDNDFGLICRYLDSDSFYYAVISSDGYYGIIKVTSDSTELLGRDNLVYSDVINQGLATNHIRFDCIGSELTLYANGEQLDQQTDTEYTHGNVGVVAGTYSTPGTDILFDNFGVYSP